MGGCMGAVKTRGKSKLMKRLPPNWGDNLLLEDIDWTLDHFRAMIGYYTAIIENPLEDTYAVRQAQASLPVVRQRIDLWTRCRAERVAGRSIMPLLRPRTL